MTITCKYEIIGKERESRVQEVKADRQHSGTGKETRVYLYIEMNAEYMYVHTHFIRPC